MRGVKVTYPLLQITGVLAVRQCSDAALPTCYEKYCYVLLYLFQYYDFTIKTLALTYFSVSVFVNRTDICWIPIYWDLCELKSLKFCLVFIHLIFIQAQLEKTNNADYVYLNTFFRHQHH